MNYFELYKQADSPYHRYFKRSQPKSKEMQERIDLYNYIKKMPQATVKVFHGTSEKIWNAIKQRGYFTSPNVRNVGDREQRTKGLDEVFFTTSISYAESYAKRSAAQDKSTPILLGLEIPIYYFIEISNVILGQNPLAIYNEMRIQHEIYKIIKQNIRKEIKYEQINESIKKWIYSQKQNEFTIKHAVPLRFVKSVQKLKSNQNESNLVQRDLTNFNQFTHEYRDYILKALQSGDITAFGVPETMKRDPEIILATVQQNSNALQYASVQLRGDKDFMLKAVKHNGLSLNYASEQLQHDKQVVLEAVKQNGHALQYASAQLRNDKDVLLEAVKQNGFALYYASAQLKNDKQVVLAVVKIDGYALRYATEQLKNDKQFVLAAVQQDGDALAFVSEQLKNDKQVVLEAVKQNGYALMAASLQLQHDKQVVLAAVKQSGLAIQYASAELRSDKDVVFEAVKQNFDALSYASADLRFYSNFVDAVMKIKHEQRQSQVTASGWYHRTKLSFAVK